MQRCLFISRKHGHLKMYLLNKFLLQKYIVSYHHLKAYDMIHVCSHYDMISLNILL